MSFAASVFRVPTIREGWKMHQKVAAHVTITLVTHPVELNAKEQLNRRMSGTEGLITIVDIFDGSHGSTDSYYRAKRGKQGAEACLVEESWFTTMWHSPPLP